ncbi:MAG TPA: hypothetical protein VEU51_14775 [Candidatus Acidoferrales bacterium]|nr:hypothetical protein [Candidatus Acidoferrales bacterium]
MYRTSVVVGKAGALRAKHRFRVSVVDCGFDQSGRALRHFLEATRPLPVLLSMDTGLGWKTERDDGLVSVTTTMRAATKTPGRPDKRALKKVLSTLGVLALSSPAGVYAAALRPIPGVETCQKLTQSYQEAIKAQDYTSAHQIGRTLHQAGCYATPEPSYTAPPACPQSIKNIASFLQVCPTADPAYAKIALDFPIRFDGAPISAQVVQNDVNAVCSYIQTSAPPAPTLLQDSEYAFAQTLRTIYYMDDQNAAGCARPYPWTGSVSLYKWMTQYIGGLDIRDDASNIACCNVYQSRSFIILLPENSDDAANDQKYPWLAFANRLAGWAHETRHAQGSAYAHTNCAPKPPCPDQKGDGVPICDPSFALANLSPYGIQYWLFDAWVTGQIEVGVACLPPAEAQSTTQFFVNAANSYRTSFCTNPPPAISAPANPPGVCPK